MERMIQYMKEEVTHRGKGQPEKVLVGRLELSRCMKKLVEGHPSVLDTTAEWLRLPLLGGAALVQSAHPGRSEYPASSGGSYCVAPSQAVAGSDGFWQLRLSMVQDMINGREVNEAGVCAEDGVTADMVSTEATVVRTYSRAILRGQEWLTSTAYGRSRSKDSSFVLVEYEGSLYVAHLRRFLCIYPPGSQHALHYGLVDYHRHRPAIVDGALGRVHVVREGDILPGEDEYPVHLDSIICKLIYTRRTVRVGAHEHKELLLNEFNVMSGSLVG